MRTVLISGTGIAGPTFAFRLKAGGFAQTLIERAPALRAGGYVIDFWGLLIRAFAIPGLARFAVGRDIIDTLQLPDYRWSSIGEFTT